MVLFHRDGTNTLQLAEGQSAVVGRAHPSDVLVADPSLSRMHARLTWRGGLLTVTDLESTNGTWLAGRAVAETTVRSGDELSLGEVSALVSIPMPQQAVMRGVDGYERTLGRLAEEVTRASAFGRPLCLATVKTEVSLLPQLCTALQAALRPVEHIGLYDSRTALVCMPEVEMEAAAASLRAVLRKHAVRKLRVGLASFPRCASSDGELLTLSREACLSAVDGEVKVSSPAKRLERPDLDDETVVVDAKMHELHRIVRQVASKSLPILIVGETGTGKESLVAALHRHSGLAGSLKAINCASIPRELTESILFGHDKGAFTGAQRSARGLFEEADGGTLFLDEVGELSASAQASLLRVLEQKRLMRVGSTREIDVNVRVVAATNRDLEQMVTGGAFREDLLYRLNAITLQVPPLRARPDEVVPLAELFLRRAVAQWGGDARRIGDEALSLLRAYCWPGNIRQLRNVIERAVALCDGQEIEAVDLPEQVRAAGHCASSPPLPPPDGTARPTRHAPPASAAQGGNLVQRVRDFERDLIADALGRSAGNVVRAAKELGVPARTLQYKVDSHGLKPKFKRN